MMTQGAIENATSAATASRTTLWALLFGNFLIGTGILIPAGMLNQLGQHFNLTPSVTAQLMLISGVVVGIGAPLAAALTSRIERRFLLTFALLLYVIGHLASGITDDFMLLQIFRALTVVGAAIFTPQAAATLGVLLPPEKRPGAIAFIFIGWSIAAVVGVPVANLMADNFGWQSVYLTMAALSAVGLAWVWSSVPSKVFTPSLNLASWTQALADPLIVTVLGVTLISFIGQFVVYSYVAPLLTKGFGANASLVSLGFAASGLAGVIANSIASRVAHRLGVDNVIGAGLAMIALGMLVFALGFGTFAFAMIALAIVGAGNFSSNSLQQSRLAQIAPAIAGATIALNTTFVYVGQAIGTWIGGRVISTGVSSNSAYVAAGFAVVALALSLLAQRIKAKASNQALG
jgi:MFS transporter, DHA1 family, inner membrane transport protein